MELRHAGAARKLGVLLEKQGDKEAADEAYRIAEELDSEQEGNE